MKKILLLLTIFLFVTTAFAQRRSDIDTALRHGRLGQIKIGDQSQALEKKLGRSIEMFFTGIDRGGSILEDLYDLKRLQANTFDGYAVNGIDIGYRGKESRKKETDKIDFLAFGLHCDAVRTIEQDLSRRGDIKLIPLEDGEWRAQLITGKYVLFGQTKKACSLYLRKN